MLCKSSLQLIIGTSKVLVTVITITQFPGMNLRSIQYKVVKCLYGAVILFQCKTAKLHHLQGFCSQTKMLLMLELQCMKLRPLAKNGVNRTTGK